MSNDLKLINYSTPCTQYNDSYDFNFVLFMHNYGILLSTGHLFGNYGVSQQFPIASQEMNQVSKLGNYLFQLLLVLVVTWKLGSFPSLGTAGKLHSFQTEKL